MTVDARSVGTGLPALKPGMSIDVARRLLVQEFRLHNLDSPELDARLLVGHALGLDHTALAAQSGRTLAPAEADAIAALAARRLAREPVARIIGVKEFWASRSGSTPRHWCRGPRPRP